MARYTGSVCKLCRREGGKLYLKGDRCYSDKCAYTRRPFVPGQHGKEQARKKMSEYAIRLREKQKTRRTYGVLETQFRGYFEKAAHMRGVTGENLLQTLERRLDNLVYRTGMGASRAEARQLVRHGHFTVNGHKVDIPSFLVRPNDVIALKEKSKESPKFKELLEVIRTRQIPSWLDMDKDNLQVTVLRKPTREEIDTQVQEHLIVELYSR